jgi:hypothetical protein
VVLAVVLAEVVAVRRPPVPAKQLGLAQLFAGLTLVVLTAVGVWVG